LNSKLIKNTGDTKQPAQAKGLNGYTVDPFLTIGEEVKGYALPGIPDGLGAFALDKDTIRVFTNHEIAPEKAYSYSLDNGTKLTGARVSFFDLNKNTLKVENAGLAINKILNRKGDEVKDAADLEFRGLNRLCSAQYVEANQFGDNRGLVDDLFFTGEETSGGTEFVLNPESGTLRAAPWMGRAAWENVTQLDTGTTDKVAFLVGDDREASPLLMYVGEKDTTKNAEILERNGLVEGKLYAWVPQADLEDTSSDEDTDKAPDPAGFNGTGNSAKGDWVKLDYYRPDLAGSAKDDNGDGGIQDDLGYDDQGFATQAQQDKLFIDAGGFQFSRIEDVATNPNDGTQAVFAASGRGARFAADNWGTTYRVDTKFNRSGDPLTGQIDILYDGDDAGDGQFKSPDFGLRSPDNLDWADNGKILIQENRATASDGDFGGTSGEEASVWELDPKTKELTRVAQIDRSAIPAGQSDSEAGDLGNWESSGILDVSELFGQDPGTRFIFGVQAHSIEDGVIADENLVQGGQLAFLTT
jgi:secreted PhoX family phosphatase